MPECQTGNMKVHPEYYRYYCRVLFLLFNVKTLKSELFHRIIFSLSAVHSDYPQFAQKASPKLFLKITAYYRLYNSTKFIFGAMKAKVNICF